MVAIFLHEKKSIQDQNNQIIVVVKPINQPLERLFILRTSAVSKINIFNVSKKVLCVGVDNYKIIEKKCRLNNILIK